MKISVQNAIREKYIKDIMSIYANADEDVGMISSNSFNFPIVAEDGEEAFVEVIVKIPKENDGYEKREEYSLKVADRKAKAEERAKAKEKKIEKDRKRREEKKLAEEKK